MIYIDSTAISFRKVFHPVLLNSHVLCTVVGDGNSLFRAVIRQLDI